MRNTILAILLILWAGAAFGAETDPIYYSTDNDADLYSNNPSTHIPLADSSEKTLQNQTSYYHHLVVGVTVPVDAGGADGIPSGRTITDVTMYANTSGSSAASLNIEVRDIAVYIEDPDWTEYDSVGSPSEWTVIAATNTAHIADTTGVLDTEATTGTGTELIEWTISAAEEWDNVVITSGIRMDFLVRMTSSGWANFYTTGSNRFRFVFTYSGAQPPTATPTATPTETHTPTSTATPTLTYTPTDTPVPPTATPLPTALPLMVAGEAGIASPENNVLFDEGNQWLIVPALKFTDGTSTTTASGVSGATLFADLGDVPSYAGNGLEVLRINTGEAALESVAITTVAATPSHSHSSADVDTGMNNNEIAYFDGTLQGDAVLVWDATSNELGIQTSTPLAPLDVAQSNATRPTYSADILGIFSDTATTGSNAEVTISSGNVANAVLNFGDQNDEDIGYIDYDHNTDAMALGTNTSTQMTITSGGEVDIANTLDVEDTVTAGNSSNTLSLVTPAGAMLDFSGNTIQIIGNEISWQPGSVATETILAPMSAMGVGTILERVRIHVADNDASDVWDFYLHKTAHTTGGASTGSELDSDTANVPANLTNKTGQDYYLDLTGGSLPYTIAAGDQITCRVRMTPDSSVNDMFLYAVEWVFRERVY